MSYITGTELVEWFARGICNRDTWMDSIFARDSVVLVIHKLLRLCKSVMSLRDYKILLKTTLIT